MPLFPPYFSAKRNLDVQTGILHWTSATLSFLLFLICGCEKQPSGVIDPLASPIFLSWATVYPDSVLLTSLPQSNNILTVTVDVHAKVSLPIGSSRNIIVTVDVISAGSTDSFLTTGLHDDGVAPDSVAGDGIYSAQIVFTITKSASGIYTLLYSATDQLGNASNQIEQPLFLIRNSHAPVLSNLVAPDTVYLPTGGSVQINMYLRATDPDGQSDIKQVYWRSLDASDPTYRYTMHNDGSAPGSVPGDSNYAFPLLIQDSPPIPRKTFHFAFQAVNNFGDTSTTIIHRLTIK